MQEMIMEFRLVIGRIWIPLKYGGKTQNIGGPKKKEKRIFTKNIRSGLQRSKGIIILKN